MVGHVVGRSEHIECSHRQSLLTLCSSLADRLKIRSTSLSPSVLTEAGNRMQSPAAKAPFRQLGVEDQVAHLRACAKQLKDKRIMQQVAIVMRDNSDVLEDISDLFEFYNKRDIVDMKQGDTAGRAQQLPIFSDDVTDVQVQSEFYNAVRKLVAFYSQVRAAPANATSKKKASLRQSGSMLNQVLFI